MEAKITEMAARIHALRDATGFTLEEMAEAAGVSVEEYALLENGKKDFTFMFLYRCAEKFGVDIIELLSGDNPRLTEYALVRSGKGFPMKRLEGFEYDHLAMNFKDKIGEPFLVKAPYYANEQDKPIETSSHVGQEFDYMLKGTIRFVHDGHEEELRAGDSVFYDSGKPHGIRAISKDGSLFLAIVMKEMEKK